MPANWKRILSVLLPCMGAAAPLLALGLAEAEALALAREPGIQAQLARAGALHEEAVARAQLPDPELQLGALNLPVDGFELDQEPMTQLRLGVNQAFPAGDTLDLRGAVRTAQGEAAAAGADVRKAMVLRELRRSWLEYQYWSQAQQIALSQRGVFEQLVTVVRTQYQVGKSDQHDLVQAELSVAMIDERLLAIEASRQQQAAALSRWLGDSVLTGQLQQALPNWSLQDMDTPDPDRRHDRLLAHPAVRAMDYRAAAASSGVELARQRFKPNWGVNVGYGWRDGENLDGSSRDDFFSAQLTFELPLFTAKRQDRSLQADVYRHQAALAQRSALLDELRSGMKAELVRVRSLGVRSTLYREELLVQSQRRSQTTLAAYRSEREVFAELVRAINAELDVALAYERLRIDYLKSLAQLRYFLDPETLTEKDHE